MKTTQDWSFITQDQPLPKPALRENTVFHALTAAYAKNQELEVYAATENIMRREKELCQAAIKDLQNLGGGAESDETLKMILEHYKSRMETAAEKESSLKKLSEDSKKLNEEYRKRTQELAEVKRNLMESQSKLREMTKVADKLSKKEEELRFIENQLRGELDKNRREMINGLYEIVAENVSDGDGPSPLGSKSAFMKRFATESEREEAPPRSEAKVENVPPRAPEVSAPQPPVSDMRQGPYGKTLFDAPIPAAGFPRSSMPPWVPVADSAPNAGRIHRLAERCARVQGMEPPKSIFSKSLVKAPDGILLCEYFFPTMVAKESRHYIFNTAYSLQFLLDGLDGSPANFTKNFELAFGDLASRLDHAQNIHLEASCKDLLNRESLAKLLGLSVADKPLAFLDMAEKCIQRFEALGPRRIELLGHQFETLIPA